MISTDHNGFECIFFKYAEIFPVSYFLTIVKTFKLKMDEELIKLQEQTKLIRKRNRPKSRLDKRKNELFRLHKAGASIAELQRYLKSKKIKVTYSTVYRFMHK